MSKKLLIEKVSRRLLPSIDDVTGHVLVLNLRNPTVRPEHPGEAGVPGEEHAGQTASGTFHHRETRSVVHRAVDRRLRLPEPRQVSQKRLGSSVPAAEPPDLIAALSPSPGSRSGSTSSERTSRGRGNSWPSGNLRRRATRSRQAATLSQSNAKPRR